ncbi:MAG: NADP-dependent oxidoreductase [Xanthomonadales bacterium]|jgi:NADPH-dependent curcumin reductase CurA|nr:NADP-dependent oxidoreductase [Xanthomonadales bacterium]
MEMKQVRLAQTPEGEPRVEDFEIATLPMPEPGNGQVLCETRYLSLDPYMRSQIAGRHISGSIGPGDPMRGETVSQVIESRSPDFSPGDWVRGFGGWQTHSVLDASSLSPVDPRIQPPSYALSLLGMTGLTAWAGMVWQADVGPGDQVLIPAVTGGVGAAAAQFCRLRGAEVVGTAGSDEKCRYAEDRLGVRHCVNRHVTDLGAALDEAFSDGIDIYFDLVGGELLNLASERLALNARVVLAGLISEYNQAGRSAGPPPGNWIKARATVTGLVVYDFEARRDEFIDAVVPWLEEGKIFQLEDVAAGIDAAPAAFCRLMRGGNFGKSVVRMGPES